VFESMFTHPLAWIAAALYGVTVVPYLVLGVLWISSLARPGASGGRAEAADRSLLGRRLALLGIVLLALAFAVNTAVILERWVEAGRPPFKTRFETLLLYPWCVAAVTLVLYGLHRLAVLVPFSAACALICLAYGLANPDLEAVFLMPALQSGWFVPHVVTYFISYGALFASCVLAGLALAAPLWDRTEIGRAHV
jgi:ABC-type transport system involved in cytochrome c biogenesis permease subunit